jgi:hypothetical protein
VSLSVAATAARQPVGVKTETPAGSSTTMRSPCTTPARCISRSARSPRADSMCGGSQSPVGVRTSSRVHSHPSAAIGAPARSRTTNGRRTTAALQRPHRSRRACIRRTRPDSTQRPSATSTPGRRVIAARTETAVTASPPTAIDRRSVNGTTASAANPTATAAPEITMLWPACVTASTAAKSAAKPRPRASRNRLTISRA